MSQKLPSEAVAKALSVRSPTGSARRTLPSAARSAGRMACASSTVRRGPTRHGSNSRALIAVLPIRSLIRWVVPAAPGVEAMMIDGRAWRTIWLEPDGASVGIIDQTRLPHRFEVVRLTDCREAAHAIKSMQVRRAADRCDSGLWALPFALRRDAGNAAMADAITYLAEQRPTAINLRWALEEMRRVLAPLPVAERLGAAYAKAAQICEDDVETCRRIEAHGVDLIRKIAARKRPGECVHILTHCNAGWLACVDWGTATSPLYHAHDEGVPLHVWG